MHDAVAAAGDDGVAPMASVVIPAHNEEAVIGRCLTRLLSGAPPGALEVVVVTNGCHDDTAGAARRAAPRATVIELAQASKIAALNAGDEAATAFPRFYLDADVELTFDDAAAVIEALDRDGVECAAPACRFELADRPWFVRRFYAVWSELPYLRDALVGNGLYALSAAGRARFDRFPELTADDMFVRNRFSRAERRVVGSASFLVHPPRTLAGLLAMRERTYRGNAELATDDPVPEDEATADAGAFGRVARSMPLSFAVYATVNLAAKARRRARRGAVRWERDDSARAVDPPIDAAGSGRPAVAYLTSRYPAVSHTFVRREVDALRSAGWRVDTYSVRAVDPDDVLAAADKDAARSTRSILPTTPGRIVASQVAALRRSPGGWARALGTALRSGGLDLRRLVWSVFYFAEAVLLWDMVRTTPARHVHAHFANVAADVARLTSVIGRLVDGEAWSWSFTMHGPTELADVTAFDLAAKAHDASGVVCISEYCRSQLMGLVDEDQWPKLVVAHCGVDLDRFAPVDRSDHDPTVLRILCVGRLVREKAQSLLVDAVAELRDRGIAAHLVLAGDGRHRDAVAARADPDLVTMLGAVNQDDIVALYGDADVFALPSFGEGVPVVLMEAMATGLAVVTTAVAGIPELVEHGRSGLVVAPGRLDALVDALAELADDPDRHRELGRAGRRAVEAAYEIDACAAAVARALASFGAGQTTGRP